MSHEGYRRSYPGAYSKHGDAIPKRIDDGNTTGVETPSAIDHALASGKQPKRAKRDTAKLVTIEADPDVMDAIVDAVLDRVCGRIDDIDERVRQLEHRRDNGGNR